ncbi:MAG TPA: translation elongation factor Ts [Alphaproteobacteria bacterium]|nr:translation elongation factor Ts [Alphaproteobacteria bacterium]
MAEISAALVKDLRTKTGAGMMDCKKALSETAGDLEAAVDWLRQKGLSQAAKKAGREAAEGLVGVATGNGVGAIVEINSETDFVARNEDFQNFVRMVAELAVSAKGDIAALNASAYPDSGRTVEDQLTHMVATIGENMRIRRADAVSVDPGVIANYIHSASAPGLGRIGVIVGLKSEGDAAKLEEAGRQLAMHIAAANPQAVTVEELDPEVVERERAVLTSQAEESGRPADIVAKMVEGRLRKFYQDAVLLEQVWVIDGETRVSKVIEQLAKDVGAPVEVAGFVRYALGEGIERKEADFASEVAATAGS